MPENDGLSFNNPIEIVDTQATPVDESNIVDPVPTVEQQAQEPVNPQAVPPIGGGGQGPPPQELNPAEGLNVEMLEQYIPEVATYLSRQGFMEVIPDGINTEDFSLEALTQTLTYNLKAREQMQFEEGLRAEQGRLQQKLSPIALQLIDYNLNNPNADDPEIKDFIQTVLNAESITALDPDKHTEQIVREYYKSNQWTNEEIEEKITTLKGSDGALLKEAQTVKPKLDQKAQSIAKAKTDQLEQIKQFESDLHQDLQGRTMQILQQGTVNGMPLNREQSEFLYSAIMNDEVPVRMKGKVIEMGFAEALVRQAKYSEKPEALPNLMLGLMVIQHGPQAVQQFIAKQTRTTETEKFLKERKFATKKGQTNIQVPNSVGKVDTGIKFNM